MKFSTRKINYHTQYDSCFVCGKGFSLGQLTALASNGKLAHYRHAKKKKWIRESRALIHRKITGPVENGLKEIRVIKHYDR